jgi:N-terminal domain of (some) glycogen debranching enzymes
VTYHAIGPDDATFLGAIPALGDVGPHPTVVIEPSRRLTRNGVVERLTVRNRAQHEVSCRLALILAADHQPMAAIRRGAIAVPIPAAAYDGGLRWTDDHVIRFQVASQPTQCSRGILPPHGKTNGGSRWGQMILAMPAKR